MAFRFIHTADWQIGKPFANFPADLAGELAAARMGIVARIAAIARAQDAAHVLVAGDVFDSERLPDLVVRRALEHLRANDTITWVLLPGNHDPARREGVWDRVQRYGLPANVIVLAEPKPFTLAGHAVVLPSPLTTKAPGRDPSEWMDHAPSAPGQLRLGLAHGSIQGFSSEGESNVAIAPDRARRANLDYLALGDWHGHTRIDARTWYAGTPEPDRYPANAPGFVLSVALDAGAPPVVTAHPSAQFVWKRDEATLSCAEDVVDLDRRIASFGPAPHNILFRLVLSGALTLSQNAALNDWIERTQARLRHLDVDARDLIVTAKKRDLDVFGTDGALRQVADVLAAKAGDANDPASQTARRALQKLYACALATAGEHA